MVHFIFLADIEPYRTENDSFLLETKEYSNILIFFLIYCINQFFLSFRRPSFLSLVAYSRAKALHNIKIAKTMEVNDVKPLNSSIFMKFIDFDSNRLKFGFFLVF